MTYSAAVRVPKALIALMSAVAVDEALVGAVAEEITGNE